MDRARAYMNRDLNEEIRGDDAARGTINGYRYDVRFAKNGIHRIGRAPLLEVIVADGVEAIHWDGGFYRCRSDLLSMRRAFDIVVDYYSEFPEEYPEETVLGYPVEFERRRYGNQFYCWAHIYIPGLVKSRVSLGDPYPAARWRRSALEDAVRSALDYIGITNIANTA